MTPETWTSSRSFWNSNPFRSPRWRWERAEQLCQGMRRVRHEDLEVCTIRQYQRALAAATEDAQRLSVRSRWPDLCSAHAIDSTGGVLRDEVESRMLAGEPLPAISGKTGLPVSVLGAYTRIFFDVLTSLSATGWLLAKVINIGAWRDRPPTDGDLLRYLGRAAGPAVLDALLGGDGQPAEARELLWRKSRLTMRGVAASMWPHAHDMAAIIAEEQVVFADVIHRECVQNNNELFANQLNLVRWIHKMPPLQESKAKQSGRKTRNGRARHKAREVLAAVISRNDAAA